MQWKVKKTSSWWLSWFKLFWKIMNILMCRWNAICNIKMCRMVLFSGPSGENKVKDIMVMNRIFHHDIPRRPLNSSSSARLFSSGTSLIALWSRVLCTHYWTFLSTFFEVVDNERVFVNDFLKNDKIPKNGCQFASMRFFDENCNEVCSITSKRWVFVNELTFA